MSATIRTAAEQRRYALYRLGIREFLDVHPAPRLVDIACTGCGAAAGQRCARSGAASRLDGTACTPRIGEHLEVVDEVVDAYRVAAQAAGHGAADAAQAGRGGGVR